MKKKIQVAFAISLFILALVGSIWRTEYLKDIVCAVVIPSFVLTVISFIEEIVVKCQEDAKTELDVYTRLAEAIRKGADLEMETYSLGASNVPYIEGQVPQKVYQMQEEANENLEKSIVASNVCIFCLKLSSVCNKVAIAGYVLLFLSLMMSPYIVNLFSAVDLNCVTLWSLALLYLSLDLKGEICAWVYRMIYKSYKKKRDLKI